MNKLKWTLLALGLTGGAYVATIRPRMLRWGAEPDDASRPLPGDDLVAEARAVITRAVTIGAPPDAIWPWIVQLGQGRGGLYSYDLLENLAGFDIHSLDYIDPALQSLRVGDNVRLVREGLPVDLRYVVAQIEPGRALVLLTPGSPTENMAAGLPFASWAFVLEPVDAQQTRLLVRWRTTFRRDLNGLLWNQYGLEPIHFLMERKMLLGIKARAERLSAGDAG